MDSRKIVFQQTGIVALGELICSGVMIGIFALLRLFDLTVLWGALIGSALAVLNFLFMAMGTSLAADRAENDNVKGGTALLQLSYILRLVVLAVVLIAFAKSGLCNVVALLLPLAFVRITLFVAEFFSKKG